MNNKNLSILCIFFFIAFINPAYNQKTLVYTCADVDFRDGLDLFRKQKYGAAQEIFGQIIEKEDDGRSDIRTDASYYFALCALNLFHKDAEYLFTRFIAENPESERVNEAWFCLGNHYFKNKRYQKSAECFEMSDTYCLNEADGVECRFKLGYSYFATNNFEKAKPILNGVRNGDSEYANASQYYFSHIAYSQGNYQTALNGFSILSKDEMFAQVIPYYIAQIYYHQNEYDLLISYVPSIIDSAVPKRKAEIARLLGEAYYQKKQYIKALPYLELYKNEGSSYTRDDSYELAYAYYNTGDYKKAAKQFESVTGTKDIMAQNAYYHLGGCYLNTGEKSKAQLAFSSASKLEFDKSIQEDALFDFAKITYELSYSPFNETIRAFNEFINKFPGSGNIDEAYDYLVKVYMVTRNYKDALLYLERIVKNDMPQSKDIRTAYQRVTYYRGLELFSNLMFEDAISLFDKSLQYSNYNRNIKALSFYWKGEAYYRLLKFREAIESYSDFIHSPGAIDIAEYNEAHYALGYCFFNSKQYNEALSWFRKYTGNEPVKKNLMGDAYTRIADCNFISRNFAEAVKYYDLAINTGITDVDYAMFQKGFSFGLQKSYVQKINVLKNLISSNPNSSYIDDAVFELGKTYVVMDSTQKAVTEYKKLISDYPGSSFVLKSFLQLGLLYYNTGNNDEAIVIYKQIISQYPNTPEAKNALMGIKNIYVDMHEEDQYFEYAKGLGDFADIRKSEQDSLTYLSGEKLYMSGDCAKSTDHFERYTERFPDGNFTLNANYFLADCYIKAGNIDNALKSYNYIISKPRNTFTEEALLNAAEILFDRQNYKDALSDYISLESIAEVNSNLINARTGIMRCHYILKHDSAAILAANSLVLTEKVPDELVREAHYMCGKSYLNIYNLESAYNEFRFIAKNVTSKEGAEAKYHIAEILYKQDQSEKSRIEIFEFNNTGTPHQYWLAKAIILLSDIYIQSSDIFQAKQTLESIINNYEIQDDGIIGSAKQKLNEIIRKEEEEKIQKMKQEELKNFEDNEDIIQDEPVKNDTVPLPQTIKDLKINKSDTITKPMK